MELSAGVLFFHSSPFPVIFSSLSQHRSILKLDFQEVAVGVHHSYVATTVRL